MSEPDAEPRVVYYDHQREAALQPGFRSGEAGKVVVDDAGHFEMETAFAISANACCALWGHGVVAALQPLAGESAIQPGREVLITPGQLDQAARIFYEADRKTYGAVYEFVAARADIPVPTLYRLVVDNREYQRTLNRLQFLATSSSRYGLGVWLRL